MNPNWQASKNILCVRADNIGDVIMSGPAIRALKETLNAKITLLTSSMGTAVSGLMDEIDEVITFDFPWVKSEVTTNANAFPELVEQLKSRKFDAAVIFTVYSQNPMPAIMLTYLAAIPNRLAYCRENPYQLLTDWVPDEEPYTFIRHQVKRDLDLVAQIGAHTNNEKLHLKVKLELWSRIENKLVSLGFDPTKKWLIVHAGVSELKRQFPVDSWVETGKRLVAADYQVILTGSKSEKNLTDQLQEQIGKNSFSTGGLFDLGELVTLISGASIILSVNTSTVHIAAAVGTPVVVLYALTNPQHTPWKVPCKVLPYSVAETLHSKNEVIKYVNQFFYRDIISMPTPDEIIETVNELLATPNNFLNQELCLIELMQERIGLL
jgi:ADP-heptose:LPS heptosyltransferase